MRNALMAQVGDLRITVYNDKTPTDEDHQALVAAFRKTDFDKERSLVVTDGGAPSTSQRADFTAILNGREFKSAVVSDSLLVKGAVTAASWFNKKIKAFSKARLDDALRYLDIPATDFEEIHSEVKRLQFELAKQAGKR